MTTVASPHFYVYVLTRPNGKPFYVGKGKGRRVFDHDREARRGHVCHKCNIIRKIWKQGGEVQRYIMLETDDEQEALSYECELITLYGREHLSNLTDGGEGISNPAPHVLAKRNASIRATWQDPGPRALRTAGSRAYWATPEAHDEARATIAARWTNPDFRAKLEPIMSAALDRRKALRVARIEAQADEIRALYATGQFSTRTLARYFRLRGGTVLEILRGDPNYQAHQETVRSTLLFSEDAAVKRSAAAKARWADPEFRAKQRAARKAAWVRRKQQHKD